MKSKLMFLVVIAMIFAVVSDPVMAMWDTTDCYSAAFQKWQNISANVACFLSIIMNDDELDWYNDSYDDPTF